MSTYPTCGAHLDDDSERSRVLRQSPGRAEAPGDASGSIPQDWDSMSGDALSRSFSRKRPTPQTTVEAIMWSVREHGLSALDEPDNIERISRCDEAARRQINERI